jgi:hypothetical protein
MTEELLKIQCETLIEILKALRDIENQLKNLNETNEMMDSRLFTLEEKTRAMK